MHTKFRKRKNRFKRENKQTNKMNKEGQKVDSDDMHFCDFP